MKESTFALIFACGIIITAVTALIPNPFIPMLAPDTIGRILVSSGVEPSGYLFPFAVSTAWGQGMDYLGLIVDVIIVWLILWAIVNVYSKRK